MAITSVLVKNQSNEVQRFDGITLSPGQELDILSTLGAAAISKSLELVSLIAFKAISARVLLDNRSIEIEAGQALAFIILLKGQRIDEAKAEANVGKQYSTSEIDTGDKWIDSKTIFRKAFTVPAQGNNNQNFQALGFTMESLIKVGGFINDGTNILMLPVPVPNFNDSVVGVAIINSGTTLQVHAGSSGAHDGGIVWLEYTKTS